MDTTTKHTDDHISPKDRVLLDTFMEETNIIAASGSNSSTPTASPEILLSLLKDAKTIVNSLNSRQEPDTQTKEIILRLATIEADLIDIKSKVKDLLNKE